MKKTNIIIAKNKVPNSLEKINYSDMDIHGLEDVHFLPYVGKQYRDLFILGESHYCDGCKKCKLKYGERCQGLTTENCMKKYLHRDTLPYENWMNTLLKFERSLVNIKTTPEQSRQIWQNILFYNFLQVAMTGTREKGSNEDYEEGRKAFIQVINKYKPRLIIVWGTSRMYQNLPAENWIDGEKIIIDGYTVLNGYYRLNDGSVTRIINVYHPSGGYKWSWWYKVITYFMKEVGLSFQIDSDGNITLVCNSL